MSIRVTPQGWVVELTRDGQPYAWGAYPTEHDAVAVEARLVQQFAAEDAAGRTESRGNRNEDAALGGRRQS